MTKVGLLVVNPVGRSDFSVHLTQRTIEALAFHGAPGTRDVRWDAVLPNFGVRVYPSGRKTFVISYRSHGRKRLMTLGAYGVLTLDAARKRARSRLVAVSDGLDPLAEAERAARGDSGEGLRPRVFGKILEAAQAQLERGRAHDRQADRAALGLAEIKLAETRGRHSGPSAAGCETPVCGQPVGLSRVAHLRDCP